MAPVGLPEVIGGKYRPRDVLGTGSTGTVYSVEHTFTGELLALKLMRAHLGASPDAIARFKREARAVSKIRSQHVVRIFDADVAPELGGVPYLVMDLLEGVDLERLAAGRRMEPETVVEWLWQIALPLDKAHAVGIVHRDLKPENLFLTRRDDGRPLIKILDFGIAKITFDSPSTTQSGLIFGTPLYMAPEQARGDPTQVGPAADRYALGLIAYQLLTGCPYRTETSLTAVLSEIHSPLRSPSARGHSLGPAFDAWFLRACEPIASERFASAEEQIEALARALSVPLPGDGIAGPSSPGASRDAFAPDSRRSQPDSGWDALLSLRDGPDDKAPNSLEGRSRMMNSTVAAAPTGRARAARKRWRVAIAGVALLALPAAFLLFARVRVPPAGTAAARPTACATDSLAAPVSPTGSITPPAGQAPPEFPPVRVVSASDLPSLAPAVSAPAPSKRTTQWTFSSPQGDSGRALATRPAPARTATPRPKSPTDDEALSDQQ